MASYLFPAEYYDPATADRTIILNCLFQAIRQKAPDVLKKLRDDVLPAFVREQAAGLSAALPKLVAALSLQPQENRGLSLVEPPSEAEKALNEWMKRFPSPHIARRAREILDFWMHNPGAMADLEMLDCELTTNGASLAAPDDEGGPAMIVRRADGRETYLSRDGVEYGPGAVSAPRFQAHEMRFAFEDAGWNPEASVWATEKRRMELEFARALAEYDARMRRMAEDRGLKRSPTKREMETHCAWWVQSRILGESQEKIARKAEKDRTAIRAAIHFLDGILEVQAD